MDLARAVAIIGMVTVHFREPVQDSTAGVAEVLYSLPRGRASILFVVLGAVAITLAATAGGRRRRELGLSLLGRSDVQLTGAYPVVTWGGPLLFGAWLGRQDLWSATVRRRLVLAGSGVAILAWALSRVLERASGASTRGSAWWRLVLDDSHSEMPCGWSVRPPRRSRSWVAACGSPRRSPAPSNR